VSPWSRLPARSRSTRLVEPTICTGPYQARVDHQWLAETTIINELIPHIDPTYRTIANQFCSA
jgi:hypothetical protein